MSKLDTLPVIIDAPGEYITRNGKRVVIHEIRPGTSTFEAKGSLQTVMPSGSVKPEFDIWHVSGRHNIYAEVGRDIVRKA